MPAADRHARPPGPRPVGGTVIATCCWGSALIVAAAVLALAGYTSRDPDSTVYSEISARLSVLPFRVWIAPDWGGS